jgi:uncharacterized Zn-finger protein
MRIHQMDPSKLHSCALCNVHFVKAFELRAHNRIHTGERPYACDQCDAKFSLRANLKLHVRRCVTIVFNRFCA